MSAQSRVESSLATTWKRNAATSAELQALLAGYQSLERMEPLSLAERIERMEGALTAEQLAKLLNVSKVTIFKQAKAGRIPSFRVGTCVRFDPRVLAGWLRDR